MNKSGKSSNGRLVTCLNVKDLHASIGFYAHLGFEHLDGEIEDGWAIINDGENELHLFQGHILMNTLNFRGGDVSAIAQGLKARGLTMSSEAMNEPDGSVGAWIRDPDGNDIYFNTFPDE